MVVGQTITGTGTFVEQIISGTQIVLSQNANSNTNNQAFTLAASTATLGGSGIISGATTVLSGSLIAPGASAGAIGTLTFDGTPAGAVATCASGATFAFDLNATSVTGDRITLSNGAAGDFVFNSNVINFTLAGAFVNGQTYVLFDGTADNQFTGLTTGGSGLITDGLSFTGLMGAFQTNSMLNLVNGDIIFNAVPEPSTVVLLTIGLCSVLFRRRRSQNA